MSKIFKLLRMSCVFLKYLYYSLYCCVFKYNYNNVWIISERGVDARDNSYHLFKYIRNNYPEIDIRFVIDDKSADYKKISRLGKTIDFGSKEHYVAMITAKVLISTHVCGYTPDMSLFTRLEKIGMFKVRGKKIYIQHGINISSLKNIDNSDLIISGAEYEFNNIIKNNAELAKKVKLTGLARFDNLLKTHRQANKIIYMPTFRRWTNYFTDKEFMDTAYYKGIQDLLNNEKMVKFLEDNNYELIFYPHFETQKRIRLFSTISNRVTIARFEQFDVQQLLNDGDLLITDFSSVFFDFGYMKKPIIYYQYDTKEYEEKHYTPGFFSYEKNGFGQIVSSVDSLVALLNKYKKKNFTLDRKYEKRIDDFYGHIDKNNCSRVFNEIIKVVES